MMNRFSVERNGKIIDTHFKCIVGSVSLQESGASGVLVPVYDFVDEPSDQFRDELMAEMDDIDFGFLRVNPDNDDRVTRMDMDLAWKDYENGSDLDYTLGDYRTQKWDVGGIVAWSIALISGIILIVVL
jgi:hypothetical protein